jgi:hypothetical protein
MAPGRGFLALGKVEEVIGDNVGFSDEDSDNDSDSSSASPAGPVLSLDTMVWSELVGRRRSYLGRCRCLLELLPWGLWWYLGLAPRLEPNPIDPILGPAVTQPTALAIAAVAAAVVVALQLVHWRLSPPDRRVLLLSPTVVDITMLVVLLCTAAIANLLPELSRLAPPGSSHPSPALASAWPALTHIGLFGPLALAAANGQPFVEPALLGELRPVRSATPLLDPSSDAYGAARRQALWLEPIISRLATALSWNWTVALGLTALFQLVTPLVALSPAQPLSAAEDAWLTVAIPGCLLLGCAVRSHQLCLRRFLDEGSRGPATMRVSRQINWLCLPLHRYSRSGSRCSSRARSCNCLTAGYARVRQSQCGSEPKLTTSFSAAVASLRASAACRSAAARLVGAQRPVRLPAYRLHRWWPRPAVLRPSSL